MNKNEKGIVCFDFDGVLATYNGWKGFDILGEPIPETIEAVRQLYKEGYYIIIFTTRLDTPILRKWLKDNNVPYDDINKNSKTPPHTSCKPIYHCIIDDRAINFNVRRARWDTQTLLKAVKRITNEARGI